jgi:two-component system response regulator NreC
MRILIVDDHTMMRSGMRALLERNEDTVVVGEAGTATEAVDLAESGRPDVVFMDITEEIVRNRWCDKVVMISAHDSRSCVESALRAGARGYVLKTSTTEEILTALEEVCAGRSYLAPELRDVGEGVRVPTPTSQDLGTKSLTARLSPRELEVLVGIAEGLSSKAIALQFEVSHRTVEAHRTNMMRKLGVRKGSELVRLAIREGLIVA